MLVPYGGAGGADTQRVRKKVKAEGEQESVSGCAGYVELKE